MGIVIQGFPLIVKSEIIWLVWYDDIHDLQRAIFQIVVDLDVGCLFDLIRIIEMC